MKTEDLIAALSADAAPRGPSLRTGVFLALAGALVVGAVVLHETLGVRGDAVAALTTSARFVFKFVVTAALAATALNLALKLSRPGARIAAAAAGLAVPALLLAAAVGLELLVVPPARWGAHAVGSYWLTCLTFGPVISLGPLALLLLALKRGAPDVPWRAGLVAGLAAGGIGTFFYAAHCPDDSPLFVALWYSLVVAMMGGLGALIGSRVLRW
ncbi:NrsF family protein [Xanthobacter sp. KR7-225]|uniref:NrsF family protein n=1 Tax=Xanthobacter sp. KR7-225 TaxID=3156613 RepID=UPI0032B4AE2A